MLWEISEFSSKLGFFLETENLSPSAQLPIQKAKQRRWGNFNQEPRQLQSDEKRKVRQAGGKPFLVRGVCNCRDFVLVKRQKNCLLGRKSAFPSTPTQTLVTESCMCEQLPPSTRPAPQHRHSFSTYPSLSPTEVLQVDCFW
uniref:Uncharacterized protein n=1 Tax=Phocoena sinus TaxID=42100 RepID=A0A8C9BX00_PHOSS